MSDFGDTWRLTRGRFDDAVSGLSPAQLNWRMQPDALTLGEMAMHVAGVEVSFLHQLLGSELDPFAQKLRRAATDGVVNDQPFPFSAEEITPDSVSQALAVARQMVAPVIDYVTDEIRAKQIKSALGPTIDGTGAFARLAYHPGYHQGQAHIVKTAAGYPA
jgi:hypothetical protein